MSDNPLILLIDDSRDILESLTIRLAAAGHKVMSTANSRDGLEMARDQSPSAIVLDLRMPGMDGFEVLAALRADPRTSETPVIVLSANVRDQSRDRASALGAACFMEKPYRADKLLSALRGVVGQNAVGRA